MSLFGNRAAIRELMRVKSVRIWQHYFPTNKIMEIPWEATVVKNSSSMVTIVLENSWFFKNEMRFDYDGAMLVLDDGSEIPLNTYRYAIEGDGDELLFIRIKP